MNAPDKLAQFIRLTREPLPASTKRYLQGSRPDIQVPLREILQSNGEAITVYDTSGPYTDPRADIDVLMQHAQSSTNLVTVDLGAQTVRAGNHAFEFTLDPFRKHCLMRGLDDIGLTLEKSDDIARYETALATMQPWI